MDIIHKLYDFYVLRNFYSLSISPDITKKLIDKLSLENQNDYISRSFKQYYGYKKIQGRVKIFVLNFVSFFVLLFFVLIFFVLSFFIKRNHSKSNIAISYAITKGIIPQSLLNKYSIIESPKVKYILEASDILFIFKFSYRYPFSFFFILKNTLKIANFSYLIKHYNCIAIIQTYEYSFTSSISTLYCNNHAIKHINVMHGEKLLYIRDSFFAFNEFYIWDEYYKELFIKLGAEPNQFIIEHPPVLNLLKNIIDYQGDKFKYFLDGSETIEQITNLNNLIIKKFKNLIFRPHPLFSNIEELKSYNFNIEDPHIVNITDSIKECEYVCSKYSTVMFQSLFMNKKIIIDDITNTKQYNELKEREYIIFSKPHQKLSSILD